jgi:hypothetical protein
MTQAKILRTLVDKRSQLFINLHHTEGAMRALRADLEHIDGAIRVFIRPRTSLAAARRAPHSRQGRFHG